VLFRFNTEKISEMRVDWARCVVLQLHQRHQAFCKLAVPLFKRLRESDGVEWCEPTRHHVECEDRANPEKQDGECDAQSIGPEVEQRVRKIEEQECDGQQTRESLQLIQPTFPPNASAEPHQVIRNSGKVIK
jgi:hypothetical protein